MARRRRRRDPFDDTVDFVRAVVALIFGFGLLVVFVPSLAKAIMGMVIFVVVAVIGVGLLIALLIIIGKAAFSRQKSAKLDAQIALTKFEPAKQSSHLNPFENNPQSDWERYGPKPPKEENLEERLRAIDWFQFEKVVSAIYEVRGYKVKRLGGANPDGGIDLIVENGDERVAIQCKHWKKWTVKLHQVRELLGALTDVKIKQGVMVTLCGCTQEAREFANKHGIVVVEEDELVKLIQMEDGSVHPQIGAMLNDKRKFCPKCESPMVERVTERGFYRGKKFWGCSRFPRCKYVLKNA